MGPAVEWQGRFRAVWKDAGRSVLQQGAAAAVARVVALALMPQTLTVGRAVGRAEDSGPAGTAAVAHSDGQGRAAAGKRAGAVAVSCLGGDEDDSSRCSAAVGEATRHEERRREGQVEEEQGCDEMAEQGCDEMAEQGEEEEAEEQGSGDEEGREEVARVEAVGGEGVWQRLMARRVRQAACKAHVLSTPLPSWTGRHRMPDLPLSPSGYPPSSFSPTTSSFSSSSSSSPWLYPPYRSASWPLTSSSHSSRSSRTSSSSSFSSSPSSLSFSSLSSSSPWAYPPYRSASVPPASTSSSPFHSFRSSSSALVPLHVPSPPTLSQFSAFNQTPIPTTTNPRSSAPTANPCLSPASPAHSRLPCHSSHEPTAPGTPLSSAPTSCDSLRPALRTSPRYQQGRAGQSPALNRSVSWADAQGKALTEELQFSTRT
ncbi:unnamed protein product [Closterium sp. Yama58-4]|nr:unnamed protein product [Closterium sp. Yama58-4]